MGEDVGRHYLDNGVTELALYPTGEDINFLPNESGRFIYKTDIDRKGKITLPKELLKKAGMTYGDDIVFAIVGMVGNICKRETYEEMFKEGRLGRFLEDFEREHDIF